MDVARDLKSPTIVIVGYWNKAILDQAGWVALNVLEVKEGAEIEVHQIEQIEPQAGRRRIWLFKSFGLSCSPTRLEIFETAAGGEEGMYKALLRLTDLLPHTPLSAVGVNFEFQIENDVSSLVGKMETREIFDFVGDTSRLERQNTLQIGKQLALPTKLKGLEPAVLNVKRATDYKIATLSVNYHQNLPDMSALSAWVKSGPVKHWMTVTQQMLDDIYGIKEFKTAQF